MVVLREQGGDARGGRRVFAVCDGHGPLGHRAAEIAVSSTLQHQPGWIQTAAWCGSDLLMLRYCQVAKQVNSHSAMYGR